MASLIPKAEEYVNEGYNVLLVGKHGVGKTQFTLELCQRMGLKLKYFSCSTLDPYTDLVGVPVPRPDEHGTERLVQIRPRDIDEAEFLMFDEFNRADPKVQNAVFEIIQFRSINGEKLPNLKCVWAAMNPPGEDYAVEDTDPALLDRFHVFEEIKPKPSIAILSRTMPKRIAQALVSWWSDHNLAKRGDENYISPRRLEDIGLLYHRTGSFEKAIGPWIECDRKKLGNLLEKAREDVRSSDRPASSSKLVDTRGDFQEGPHPGITYDHQWIEENATEVAAYLRDNQEDMLTHSKVLDEIRNRHVPRLADSFSEVLAGLKPSLLEKFVYGLSDDRFHKLRESVRSLDGDEYQPLQKVLQIR